MPTPNTKNSQPGANSLQNQLQLPAPATQGTSGSLTSPFVSREAALDPNYNDYKVTVIKDSSLKLPELFLEVYVAGDAYEERAFADMFVRARCTKAHSPETADLVIFTGGPDVNPLLYDEEKHHTTRIDAKRDEEDIKLYEYCYENGIPMFGVCRGAQFLHVMNGGKLYQDINNHTGDHNMYDTQTKVVLPKVSSVHHQAVIANIKGGMLVLADCFKSTVRHFNPTTKDESPSGKLDIEAFFYRSTCCLGVQGHPEYKGYHQFMQWTLEKISQYIVESPDLELRGKCRRMKQELIDERDAILRQAEEISVH